MRFFILLFSILISVASFGQQYTFLSYSTEQGLPQTQVTSVVQDDLNFLWVGTLGGLAKFNGKEFEPFTADDGLLNNRISTLSFFNKELWIGHEGGVSKKIAGGFKNWQLDKAYRKVKVSKILPFNNQLIFSTNGSGLYKIVKDKLSKISISITDTERIRDIAIHGKFIYIATKRGVFYSSDLKKWNLVKGLEEISISSLKSNGKIIYAATFQDGLFKINESTHLASLASSKFPSAIKSLYFNKENQCWINTNEGIFLYDNTQKIIELSEKNGLPMQAIQEIFEDNHGNIWLASEGKGLIRFTGKTFVYYNKNAGLSSDLYLSISQDRQKNFWFGSYDKGLDILYANGQRKSIEIGNNTVWSSIHDVDGLSWVGTGSGLFALSGEKILKEYYYEDGTPGDKITTLFKMNSSTFYIGGAEGVSIYRNGKIKKLGNDGIETVRSFCKYDNTVYCATDMGLFKIQNDQLIAVGNFYKSIYGIESDNKGNLWIGTEEGLFLFDGEKTSNINYSKNPASNYINFLNRRDDNLYVGTNNGLYIISEGKGKGNKEYKAQRFGTSEGIVNLETNINASYFDYAGNLWFGTASGLVKYRPALELGHEEAPLLILKNLIVNFQKGDFDKYSDHVSKLGIPNQLVLPYNKNNLAFDFQAISLANFPGMQYQYKLEGLESNWSPASNNSSISYNSLPAGNYVLLAKCIDAQGKVSNQIRIPITVKQAFYKTWWFFTLVLAIVSLIVYNFFRLKLKGERDANERERLEFKSRLLSLEQRSLNASMNRHFIFNSLNSIQYFINTQDKLSANRFLTNFAKLIRKNLDSSEEGNQVTLAQELDRLDLYLSLESMRFKDRFSYSITCDEEVEQDEIIIPAMILQPFVENSIIHGILPNEDKVGKIEVDINMVDEYLVINLSDNGVGIEESKKNKTEYDGDHKSQGMEITSKRIELLNKFGDRRIEIIGPIQIEDEYRRINGTYVTIKIQIINLDN
ncbi:MAG: two-component regulator propeller domain-containing protein [Bacteroidota bacterium]